VSFKRHTTTNLITLCNLSFALSFPLILFLLPTSISRQVQAPAKAGAIAPINVHVEAGNTGLGPEKTSFFQALHIATKITRGTIEILNNVHLIHIGEKVGASEATLLSMLKIYPFSYGLEISQVYEDGAVFSPKVLDIKMEDLLQRFMEGVGKVAALSLQIGYPTVASVPHSIVNGFKRLLAVAVATDISFPEAEQAKAFVADPSAFVPVVTQTEAADTGGGGGGGGEEEKEEKKAEEEEESDDDMGFGLFD
jgi:large subunit ribosomal protein LP0